MNSTPIKKGNTAVFGIFSARTTLEGAVDALKMAGFRYSDISVLMPDAKSTADFATEKSTKAPEGASTGAAGGLAVGGVWGWLVGIGALAIPGIGPFVAAGPIVSALAGAGIGGTLGGLTGALVGLGIPEYEAKRYETFVKGGGMLISVHVDDGRWAQKAKEILESCGAVDIDSKRESRARGPSRDQRNALPSKEGGEAIFDERAEFDSNAAWDSSAAGWEGRDENSQEFDRPGQVKTYYRNESSESSSGRPPTSREI